MTYAQVADRLNKAADADNEKRITDVLQQHGPRTVHSYTQAL